MLPCFFTIHDSQLSPSVKYTKQKSAATLLTIELMDMTQTVTQHVTQVDMLGNMLGHIIIIIISIMLPRLTGQHQ